MCERTSLQYVTLSVIKTLRHVIALSVGKLVRVRDGTESTVMNWKGERDSIFAKTRRDRPWGPLSLLKWILGLFSRVKRPKLGADHRRYLA
jgi:hypothetical protein